MTCYAIGHLREVEMNPDIVAYLQGVDATLAPFGGQFLVHGAQPSVLEGDFSGDLIIIAFPDRPAAEGWYRSAAYQALLPLRLRNATGEVILIEGVDADHKATDILKN